MSTRGALGVKMNGKFYVTYNHSDSYPSWLGVELLKFCHEMNKVEGWGVFQKNMKRVRKVNSDSKVSKKNLVKYAGLAENVGTAGTWYQVLRAAQGAETLWKVFDGSLSHWVDDFTFLKDGLFCEYAYIIDLDDWTFKFFKGSQKTADKSDYLPFEKVSGDNGYFPVHFVFSASLNTLDIKWKKD